MKTFEFQEITKPQQSFVYPVSGGEDVTIVVVALRQANVRLSVRLTGIGASATVIGFVSGRKDERIAIHTEQLHVSPQTTSNVFVKAALQDESFVSYDGIIRIERRAQKSDAYQKNDNLLLSPLARARSDPALEILANDVRCTHGSTTGKLNEDQLWYLGSSGLSGQEREELLVRGFFENAIGMISDTMIQAKVRKLLWMNV